MGFQANNASITVRQEGAGSVYDIDSDDVLIIEDESGTREILAEDYVEDDNLTIYYGGRQERLESLYQARTSRGNQLGVDKKLRDPGVVASVYQDESSGQAIDRLKKIQGMISGETMALEIYNATCDPDSHAASSEYADLKKFVTENYNRLSPEAIRQFSIYEKYVFQAQSRGSLGIAHQDYQDMISEMKGDRCDRVSLWQWSYLMDFWKWMVVSKIGSRCLEVIRRSSRIGSLPAHFWDENPR